MRILLPILSVALLAACQPPVPLEPTQGVGFESYSEYQRRREAELRANTQVAPSGVQTYTSPYPPVPGAAPGGAIVAGPIGSDTSAPGAPLSAISPQASAPVASVPQPAIPQSSAGLEPSPNPVSISDENDFSAVASRETIESDKQRIEQNKAQYQQVQPSALPERPNTGVPVVVEYAISAPNRLGEAIYKRSGNAAASQKACARYGSPEAAQEAFLKAGGPKRDTKNLDPDGDGFACFWDPTPFQKARG